MPSKDEMTKKAIKNLPKSEARKLRISVETQVKLWKELAGRWKDDRSTKEIIEDIYSSRTPGRSVNL